MSAYLSQSWAIPSSANYFNKAGRGYPDVATYGSNYFVYLNGAITRESGTSASAPVFAAMVTLWNDMRLKENRPPMGFIAPYLYDVYATHPEAFNDIVTGDNVSHFYMNYSIECVKYDYLYILQACGTGSNVEQISCCSEKFSAAPGWDAVTGLGSPNFGLLTRFVMSRPHSNTTSHYSHSSSGNRRYAYTITDGYYQEEEEVQSRVEVKDGNAEYKMIAIVSLVAALVSLTVTVGVSYQLYIMNSQKQRVSVEDPMVTK